MQFKKRPENSYATALNIWTTKVTRAALQYYDYYRTRVWVHKAETKKWSTIFAENVRLSQNLSSKYEYNEKKSSIWTEKKSNGLHWTKLDQGTEACIHRELTVCSVFGSTSWFVRRSRNVIGCADSKVLLVRFCQLQFVFLLVLLLSLQLFSKIVQCLSGLFMSLISH